MEIKRDYKYYKEIFENTTAPFAYVDLDLLRKNITDISKRAEGKPIRVASKSVRCLSVIQKILNSGLKVAGVMSYCAQDTIYLSQNGVENLLLAYPVVDEFYIHQLALEIKKGKKIVLMVDLPEHVERINEVGKLAGVQIPICLDIDMTTRFPGIYFGVYRSSLKLIEEARKLYQKIKNCDYVELKGIMGYEAQIAGLADNDPINGLKNPVIRLLKSKSVKIVADRRTAIINMLGNEGAELEIINAGGTGSIETSIQEPLVTEVTAGSGFFNSKLFDYYHNFQHEPAAAFGLEVVRIPQPGVYTCYGGGFIASGPVGKNKQPSPYLPQQVKTIESEGFGEVQTPILSTYPFQIGDPVFFRHAKAGELCEHFDKVYLVENGEIVAQAPTFRGDRVLEILNFVKNNFQ
ncbi:amino acid deaminase/aldolase [Flexithrix dorotheae]|uniref:amino acid deaminase/aldolase n=1 Tax=Flexithrix dorotheae TaxID=70993 RepID=UPI001FE157B2|nr:amino acid deaminase/aldolase [Flexithrix dorotheae]